MTGLLVWSVGGILATEGYWLVHTQLYGNLAVCFRVYSVAPNTDVKQVDLL